MIIRKHEFLISEIPERLQADILMHEWRKWGK